MHAAKISGPWRSRVRHGPFACSLRATWVVAKKDRSKVLKLKGSKVVVSKGAKKGTFTLKLKAKVVKSDNYRAATSKTVAVRVRIR